ncbi:MAG: hypothetical protein WD035_02460 [Balneolaceae bacterium]
MSHEGLKRTRGHTPGIAKPADAYLAIPSPLERGGFGSLIRTIPSPLERGKRSPHPPQGGVGQARGVFVEQVPGCVPKTHIYSNSLLTH